MCEREKRGRRMSKRECEGREDERGESVCVRERRGEGE